jgi:hypothetical protein
MLVWSLMWRQFSNSISFQSKSFLSDTFRCLSSLAIKRMVLLLVVLQIFRISVFFCLWSFLKWCKLDNFVLLFTSRKKGLSAFPNLYDIFCCIFLSNQQWNKLLMIKQNWRDWMKAQLLENYRFHLIIGLIIFWYFSSQFNKQNIKLADDCKKWIDPTKPRQSLL